MDANNPAKKTEDREEVTFSGPVDSVYLKAKDYVELDVGTGAWLGRGARGAGRRAGGGGGRGAAGGACPCLAAPHSSAAF